MSVSIQVEKVPISLEKLNDGREVKICILLTITAFCLLISLLGLGALKPNIKHFKILKVRLWAWSVLGLCIMFGSLVGNLIVDLVLYLSKLSRFCRVRILFFITEEKNSLRRFFWSIIVFFIWYYMMYHALDILTEYHDGSQDMILTLLFLMMIDSFAWLAMSILLKLHRMKCLNEVYFDRATKSILEQYVLRMLMNSPKHQNHEISIFNDLSQLNKKDVTARILNKLMNMIRDGGLPSSEELNQKHNSIEIATTTSILQNISKLGFSSNHVENIKKFLSEQKALTLNIFEGDEINEKALHLWVKNVYKDRHTLISDIKKTDTAITKQHLVVRIAVGVILIFYTWYVLQDDNKVGEAPAAAPELSPLVHE